MSTLVATVSIGPRSRFARRSIPRLEHWCHAHGLEFVVVREPLIQPGLPPHFNKLAVPACFPGHKRYVIVDDDLLIARHAPAPPEVPSGFVGLVADSEQRHTSAPGVDFTGNTGFIVADAAASPLFADALARGPTADILGTNDQSALNRSAWEQKRVHRLDPRWNHLPVIDHIVTRDAWRRWTGSRLHRLAFYLSLLPGAPTAARRTLRSAYGVHLVRAPHPALYSLLVA
jgi:hypothetical protein